MDQPTEAPAPAAADTPVHGSLAVEVRPTPVPAVTATWREELRWHALAVALTVAALVGGLRLDTADYHAPFSYEYDALLILPFVKATVERGSHWRNERLGAPGIQELHDFPVVDHLHFAVIWLMGRFFPDPVVVFNLFYLLTYPLTAVTSVFVLRRFGLSPPAAVAGAVLYAFQPYHYLRGQVHYFLAAYYIIPLTLLTMLWVCQGRLPYFRRTENGTYRFAPWTGDSWAATIVAAATACAGAYYAFFACALLVMAGVYGWAVTRTWRAAASAFGVIGVIVAIGVLNHAPSFVYHAQYGAHPRPTQRPAEDAERYGMRITQLILPVAMHNPIGIGNRIWIDLAAVRSKYQAPAFKDLDETDWDPLGAVGAVGYLLLLAWAVVPVRRRWPLGPLSALAVFATLVGTLGGLGSAFNLLVTPQVRCYNRISIYIAFLALFAVCWLIDRFFDARSERVRRLRWPAFLALTAFGVWDQTPEQWFPDLRIRQPGYVSADDTRAKVAEQYWEDRAFFARVEELMPEGAVFTYPFVEYPESPPVQASGSPGKVESYDMVLGYLHTRRLRWSFGAMKGREADEWMREVAARLGAEAKDSDPIRRMIAAGFDGLLVDARGFNPHTFHKFKEKIEGVLGHGALRDHHPGRQLYFYDLRGYRDWLRGQFGPAGLDALARQERERISVLWLKGFWTYEQVGYEWKSHWAEPVAHLVFVNPMDRPVTATYRMQFRTAYHGPARLQIHGGVVWVDDLEIGPDGEDVYTCTLTLPPGRHTIVFRCTPLVNILPTDSRNQVFSIRNFRRADPD